MHVPKTLTRNWLLSFAAYPVGGLFVSRTVGAVDTFLSAGLGGLVVGAVVGSAQCWTGTVPGNRWRWITASSLGLALGSVSGAVVLGYSTSTIDVVVRGVIVGSILGLAQAASSQSRIKSLVVWVTFTAISWGLGWWVTAQVINDITSQYAVFGSTGAVAASIIQLPAVHWINTQKQQENKT